MLSLPTRGYLFFLTGDAPPVNAIPTHLGCTGKNAPRKLGMACYPDPPGVYSATIEFFL